MIKILFAAALLAAGSEALGLDLRHFFWLGSQPSSNPSEPQVVEVVRWRQPVCLAAPRGVPACFLKLRKYQTQYEQQGELQNSEIVKAKRNLQEPVNILSPELVSSLPLESLQSSEVEIDSGNVRFSVETPEISDLRHRRHLVLSSPANPTAKSQIYVTKVLKSPVTATLVASNCVPDIGVPLCEGQSGAYSLSDEPMNDETLSSEDSEDGTLVRRSLGNIGQIIRESKIPVLEPIRQAIDKSKDVINKAVRSESHEDSKGIIDTIVNEKKKFVEAIPKPEIIRSFLSKLNPLTKPANNREDQKGSRPSSLGNSHGNGDSNPSQSIAQTVQDALAKPHHTGAAIADSVQDFLHRPTNVVKDLKEKVEPALRESAEKLELKPVKDVQHKASGIVNEKLESSPLKDSVEKLGELSHSSPLNHLSNLRPLIGLSEGNADKNDRDSSNRDIPSAPKETLTRPAQILENLPEALTEAADKLGKQASKLPYPTEVLFQKRSGGEPEVVNPAEELESVGEDHREKRDLTARTFGFVKPAKEFGSSVQEYDDRPLLVVDYNQHGTPVIIGMLDIFKRVLDKPHIIHKVIKKPVYTYQKPHHALVAETFPGSARPSLFPEGWDISETNQDPGTDEISVNNLTVDQHSDSGVRNRDKSRKPSGQQEENQVFTEDIASDNVRR